MIVLDASVFVLSLTDDGPMGNRSRTALAGDTHWAAPEHLIVEAFSAIRGRYLGSKISERRAVEALQALNVAAIEVLGVKPLLARMWQLRSNLSGYDAAYVAAAEAFDCPLLTADTRLAAATGLRCAIRLVS